MCASMLLLKRNAHEMCLLGNVNETVKAFFVCFKNNLQKIQGMGTS